MSIETFLLTNFVMNLTVFAISARIVGHIRWLRVIIASVVGSGYAAAALRFGQHAWLKGIPAQIISLIILALIVFGSNPVRCRRIGTFMILLSSLIAGGIMTLLKRWIPSGGALLILAGWPVITASVFLLDIWKSESADLSDKVTLRISTRMGSCEVQALVDTGNRLHEPLSGLPVVIVGRRSLQGILDSSCLGYPPSRLPPGFRLIHYGALGGNGQMHCFRPKSVSFKYGKQWNEAPDMWVAIYPDELPSHIEAVAPPVFNQPFSKN